MTASKVYNLDIMGTAGEIGKSGTVSPEIVAQNRVIDGALRIYGAQVIDKETRNVYGGEGTTTLFVGDYVIVGKILPVEHTTVIPPTPELSFVELSTVTEQTLYSHIDDLRRRGEEIPDPVITLSQKEDPRSGKREDMIVEVRESRDPVVRRRIHLTQWDDATRSIYLGYTIHSLVSDNQGVITEKRLESGGGSLYHSEVINGGFSDSVIKTFDRVRSLFRLRPQIIPPQPSTP